MTRRWPVLLVVLFAVAAAPLLVGSGAAYAAPKNPAKEVLGRWSGFARGCEGQVTCALDVSSARNRRFEGKLHGLCDVFAVTGTLSAAGILNIQGVSTGCDSLRLKAHGRVGDVGGVLAAALDYDVADGKKGVDCGELVLMQLLGGASWDDTEGTEVDGSWAGDAPSNQSPHQFLAVELSNLAGRRTESTALSGKAMFYNLPLPGGGGTANVKLALQGSILPEGGGGTSEAALIGADPETGIIAILIGVHAGASDTTRRAIGGSYMLFSNTNGLGGWFSESQNPPFMAGTYDVAFGWGITYKLVTDIPGENFGSTVGGTITFPVWSIGDAGFAIEDAIAFKFHVSGYSPAGTGWSSDDPDVVARTDNDGHNPVNLLDFRVGTIGDPALLPYVEDSPHDGAWLINKTPGADHVPTGIHLHSRAGPGGEIWGRWLWNSPPFSIDPPSYDGANAVSRVGVSWHLAR